MGIRQDTERRGVRRQSGRRMEVGTHLLACSRLGRFGGYCDPSQGHSSLICREHCGAFLHYRRIRRPREHNQVLARLTLTSPLTLPSLCDQTRRAMISTLRPLPLRPTLNEHPPTLPLHPGNLLPDLVSGSCGPCLQLWPPLVERHRPDLMPTLPELPLEKTVGYRCWAPQAGTQINGATSSRKGGSGWSSVPGHSLCLQLARLLES